MAQEVLSKSKLLQAAAEYRKSERKSRGSIADYFNRLARKCEREAAALPDQEAQ